MTAYDDFEEVSELDLERQMVAWPAGASFTDEQGRFYDKFAMPLEHGLVKPGWYCSLEKGHDGPCAAWPVSHEAAECMACEKHGGPLIWFMVFGYILLFAAAAYFGR